eukprot:8410150-Heterocapsa_arctica.AAC.1
MVGVRRVEADRTMVVCRLLVVVKIRVVAINCVAPSRPSVLSRAVSIDVVRCFHGVSVCR